MVFQVCYLYLKFYAVLRSAKGLVYGSVVTAIMPHVTFRAIPCHAVSYREAFSGCVLLFWVVLSIHNFVAFGVLFAGLAFVATCTR